MAREQPDSETQLELPLAPAGDVEHFYNRLHEVLNEIDFGDRTGHLMERLRRLFNRAQLDRNELNILRGILSAVQGRPGQPSRRHRQGWRLHTPGRARPGAPSPITPTTQPPPPSAPVS